MTGFPATFDIGPVRIAPATVLAPMAGVTDTVFRRFIRNLGGCGLIMTEFTSSHGVSASLRAAGLFAVKRCQMNASEVRWTLLCAGRRTGSLHTLDGGIG